jgi:hypothetical protein
MPPRGTRGAYRKEDRIRLPIELQKELVEKAATRCGNFQELAKRLNIPKSSVHYYRTGRLTMPMSVMEGMLDIAGDQVLMERVTSRGLTKDRTWANEYAVSIYREMCRDKLRLPTRDELERDDELRRKTAALISYVLAEGSVWVKSNRYDEGIVNITFADHEDDLYEHFRTLCRDVFHYDTGPPQLPGNGARAIRGFIYSTFIAQWLVGNGVPIGDKSSQEGHLPEWLMHTRDRQTIESALQPWCDGEGGVSNRSSTRPGFSVTQSRHTDLDFGVILQARESAKRRDVPKGDLKTMQIFDLNLYEYCRVMFRSEILEDVAALFRRIGFHPKMNLDRIHLKDDGFCSCIWTIRFGGFEAVTFPERMLIIQRRKLRHVLKSG